MKKYIFPTNYKYANKFLGIIEYRVLLPLAIYGAILFFILYLLHLDFFIAFGIFSFLFIPPVILLGMGIQKEPFLPFLLSIYRFKKNARVYLFQKSAYSQTIEDNTNQLKIQKNEKSIAKNVKKRYDLLRQKEGSK